MMNLETDALLFSKPKSLKRRDFHAFLFWEKSLKQFRDVQIYGLLPHKVWLDLESSPDVVDYNEAPVAVSIPMDNSVFKHRFDFAVRRSTGLIEVIDVGASRAKLAAEDDQTGTRKDAAIKYWCEGQDIRYRLLTREYFSGMELRLANVRTMLKFLESVSQSRDVLLEEKVGLLIAQLGPLQIRDLLLNLQGSDETIAIAHVARGILTGAIRAAIDKHKFDGALVIDVAES